MKLAAGAVLLVTVAACGGGGPPAADRQACDAVGEMVRAITGANFGEAPDWKDELEQVVDEIERDELRGYVTGVIATIDHIDDGTEGFQIAADPLNQADDYCIENDLT